MGMEEMHRKEMGNLSCVSHYTHQPIPQPISSPIPKPIAITLITHSLLIPLPFLIPQTYPLSLSSINNYTYFPHFLTIPYPFLFPQHISDQSKSITIKLIIHYPTVPITTHFPTHSLQFTTISHLLPLNIHCFLHPSPSIPYPFITHSPTFPIPKPISD